MAIGIQTNATGSSMILTNASGVSYLINETNQASGSTTLANGTVVSQNINSVVVGGNVPVNNHGKRLSWIELR